MKTDFRVKTHVTFNLQYMISGPEFAPSVEMKNDSLFSQNLQINSQRLYENIK